MGDPISFEQRRVGLKAIVLDVWKTLSRQLEQAKDEAELQEIAARIAKLPELLTPVPPAGEPVPAPPPPPPYP